MAGGKEVILPSLLAPIEYIPEYPIPKVLQDYGKGSMLLEIRHNWSQYCNGPSRSDCEGKIDVPLPSGVRGSRNLYCHGCKQTVTVTGLGAMRRDVIVDIQNRQKTKEPSLLSCNCLRR